MTPKTQDESKEEKKRAMLRAADLESPTGMKMVFITASPVLTNEVRRFYGSLKGKLLYFLRQRDERIQQRKEQFQNITEEEAKAIVDQVIAEQTKEAAALESLEDQQKREILEFIRTEERNLTDDLQLESDMNLPNAFT